VPHALDAQGAAADGFAARWTALGPQIGRDGAAGRLDETASALDGVAEWIRVTRRGVAGEVGACLGSAQAVTVRSSGAGPDSTAGAGFDPDAVRAAADIAAHVLSAVLDRIDDGWRRYGDWARLADVVPVRTASVATAPIGHRIELR
jgi:hypothetical protein